LKIAVVSGDDVSALLPQLRQSQPPVRELQSGAALPERVLTANAYLGARPIQAALDAGAQVVITGRCVDSAVTLGVLMHEFKWQPGDFDLLAAGSLAGHIIECGCQATGGLHTDWDTVPDWPHIGYPIVECGADGGFVVTKPAHTGGKLTPAVVGEQMLYEIGDPAAYLLPDVVADFTQVRIEQAGEHRVRVHGARGRAPTASYKVSATYVEGFKTAAQLTLVGFDAVAKARRTGEAILARTGALFAQLGFGPYSGTQLEVLGAESCYGPHAQTQAQHTREAVLRLAVTHPRKEALELFAREVAPAGTSWAPGTTGAGGGRASVSPSIRQYAFLLDKSRVQASVHIGVERIEVPHAETLRRRWRRWRRAAGKRGGSRASAKPEDDAPPGPGHHRSAPHPPRLGPQRRQGRHLEHRRHRAPPRPAAAAARAAHRSARGRMARPPRRGPRHALRGAGHRCLQLRLRTGAGRRRHGLAAQRPAGQGHGADPAGGAGAGEPRTAGACSLLG
jgi:hypothetical protein